MGSIVDKGSGTTDETNATRIAELNEFVFRGFGTCNTQLGTVVYGSDLESTLDRQSLSAHPSIWNAGISAPITDRIAKGASSLPWGCDNTNFDEDNALLLGGFPSWGEANFADYSPGDSKTDNRPREPVTINTPDKCAVIQSRRFLSFMEAGA